MNDKIINSLTINFPILSDFFLIFLAKPDAYKTLKIHIDRRIILFLKKKLFTLDEKVIKPAIQIVAKQLLDKKLFGSFKKYLFQIVTTTTNPEKLPIITAALSAVKKQHFFPWYLLLSYEFVEFTEHLLSIFVHFQDARVFQKLCEEIDSENVTVLVH